MCFYLILVMTVTRLAAWCLVVLYCYCHRQTNPFQQNHLVLLEDLTPLIQTYPKFVCHLDILSITLTHHTCLPTLNQVHRPHQSLHRTPPASVAKDLHAQSILHPQNHHLLPGPRHYHLHLLGCRNLRPHEPRSGEIHCRGSPSLRRKSQAVDIHVGWERVSEGWETGNAAQGWESER